MTGHTDQGAVPAPVGDTAGALPGTLPERPFGVHFTMARWKSLVILIALPLLLLVTQIVVFQGVVLIEGPADPEKPELTPLTIAATGLSTAIAALIATVMVAKMAKVPWRAVFRHTRPFDRRRLVTYLLAAAGVVGLGALCLVLIAPPETTGWDITAAQLGPMTIVAVLTALVGTPLQSAGEEVLFRGVAAPAAGSWFRSTRLAVLFAIPVSGLLFAVVHVSVEPWFVSYLFVFSAATVIMGLISGGLEAAMAFHVSNNLTFILIGIFFGTSELDRSTAGSGPGAYHIILMVMNALAVLMVWLVERAKRSRALREGNASPVTT